MLNIFNLKKIVKLWLNKMRGRSFSNHPRETIFIDPTGLCNLGCRFCAYPKVEKGFHMSLELFKKVVKQATDMNFSKVFVTPMLGEAFMDKTIKDKLMILENDDKITGYGFYTNFVLADVEFLMKLKKLKNLSISVYGLDPDEFHLVTTKKQSQFEMFKKNMEKLMKFHKEGNCNVPLHFSIRAKVNDEILKMSKSDRVKKILSGSNEVHEILRYFSHSSRISVATTTDTWLGEVSQKDVDILGYKVDDAGSMLGPCNLIFGAVQIRFDGGVHACTRSVKNKLMIGNINEKPLSEILSYKRNSIYKNLIDDHTNNNFPEVCRGCAHYRSVYENFESGHGSGNSLYAKQIKLIDSLKILN